MHIVSETEVHFVLTSIGDIRRIGFSFILFLVDQSKGIQIKRNKIYKTKQKRNKKFSAQILNENELQTVRCASKYTLVDFAFMQWPCIVNYMYRSTIVFFKTIHIIVIHSTRTLYWAGAHGKTKMSFDGKN